MDYWTIGGFALVTTMASVPFIRRCLVRSNVLDHPNERSSHRHVVPRGGGVACLVGVVSGVGLAAALGLSPDILALCAALAISAVGLIDDVWRLPAAPRLVLQIVIGGTAGAFLGGPGLALLGAFIAPVIVNVVNFMDGINGLTAMNMAVWGIAVAVGAASAGASALAVLGAVAAGSALGFLPWNAPRASIFLGDVGSYLFGALVVVGLLIGASSDGPVAVAIAPLLIPVVDVAVTLARRAHRRQPLAQAHREHIYQRIAGQGAAHVSVALAIASLSAVLAAVWAFLQPLIASALSAAAVLLYLALPRLISPPKAIDGTPTR